MIIAVLFGYFSLDGWFIATTMIFIFIALIIPIGARKFMPARRQLAVDSPSDAAHPFLYRAVPTRLYQWIKRGTRNWLVECGQCGHKRDFWDAGGLRGGGVGEPRVRFHCPACEAFHWHKVRRKTAAERVKISGQN